MRLEKQATTIKQILDIANKSNWKYTIDSYGVSRWIVKFEQPCPIESIIITNKEFKSLYL